MIELTYKELNNQQFNEALSYIKSQNTFKSFQASYNIARVSRQIAKELKNAQEVYSKQLLEKHLVKDENGKPVVADTPNSFSPFKLDNIAEFETRLKDFLETKVEIASHKITPTDLEGLNLSPEQIIALEPIFDQAAFYQLDA